MERLKQRRDDRKKKAEEDKIGKNEYETGKMADAQFEKMVKKKKAGLTYQPDQVLLN